MKKQIFFSLIFVASLFAANNSSSQEGSFYSEPQNDVGVVCSDHIFYGGVDNYGNPVDCYRNCQMPVWSKTTGTEFGYQQLSENVVQIGESEREWHSFKMVNEIIPVACEENNSVR
jgi:hypothetical protein